MTQKIRNITSIVIKNFQSHRKTILNLDEGVNVIVGPSDVGKTAILRALGWVFFNEPSGDAFIRMGEKEASVEVKYDDGFSVKRIRNKSFNGYHIFHPEYDEVKKLSGFGSGVPEEIIDITGVRKFQITDDLNSGITYQTQLEGAFLLSQSKDKKAKAIGAISNVNIIDKALKLGKSYIKDYRKIVNESEEETNQIEDTLKEFDSLNDEKQSLKNLKSQYNDITNIENDKNKLSELNNRLVELNKEILYEHSVINSLEFIPNATNEYNGVNILISKGVDLNRLFMTLITVSNNISLNQKIISNTNYVDDMTILSSELSLLIKKYNSTLSVFKNLNRVEEEIKNNNIVIEKTKDVDTIIKNYIEIENVSNIYNKLRNLNNKLNQLDLELNTLIKDLDSNLYNNTCEYYNFVINKISDYFKLYPLYTSYIQVIDEYKKTLSIINNEQNEINDLLSKYIYFLKESKICPLCGAEISEEHINKIMEEYKNEL